MSGASRKSIASRQQMNGAEIVEKLPS